MGGKDHNFKKFGSIRWMLMIGGLAGVVGCGSAGGGNDPAGTASQTEQTPSVQNAQVSTAKTVAEMKVGDLYVVPLTDSNGSVDFTGASSSSQYLMIVQAANPGGSSSTV